MSGIYGYPNDPTSTTGTVGTGGGAGGVNIGEGATTVAALNNGQRGLVGDIGMYRNDTSGKHTTGGTANAYTVTLESVPTALADGLGFSAIIHVVNTGATTINVNSIGAKKVLYKTVAMSAGELVAGQVYRFSYDASADSAAGAWLVENPSPVAASLPTYAASDITNDSGVVGATVDLALNQLDTDKLEASDIAGKADQSAVDLKAPLASPALTGNPTAPTQTAGNNSTRLATTAFVLANGASGPGFTSSEQTITTSGLLTLAHGLGVRPSLIQVFLRCKVADSGFSIGDELEIPATFYNINSAWNSCYADATNIYMKFNAQTNVYLMGNKTSGANAFYANTSWRLIVKGWE